MKYKLNYYKILGFSLIPINIILIGLLELDFLGILPAYWNSLWVFYLLLIIDTAFLALRLNKMSEEGRENDYTVFWSKYLFLLGLIVLAVNQFLKRQIITDYMSYIIGTVIALGFLTFFASKNRVEKEIEDEKEKEEQAEKKRKDEFATKFPFINKIWGVRSIIKWCYKEGWWYSGLLILIVVVGFMLRVWNISSLALLNDEYTHLIAAKHYVLAGYFDYSRSPIITWIVIFIMKIFNTREIVLLRIPFVIMGIISIILFYFIGKLENKRIGLIASYLFAFCPLAIGLGNYIREYEFFLLIINLILYFSIKNYKHLKNKFPIVLVGFILLFLIYRYNDLNPIIILILTVFIGILIFSELLNRFLKESYLNNLIKLSLLIILFYIGQQGIYLFLKYPFLVLQNLKYLFLINDNLYSYNQGVLWYFSFIPASFIIFILVLPALLRMKSSYMIASTFTTLFILSTYINFINIRDFEVRYAYYLVPLVIISLSLGFFYFCKFFNDKYFKNNILKFLFILILFFFIFNPFNSIYDTLNVSNGERIISTKLYSLDSNKLLDYIKKENLTEKKILTNRPQEIDFYLNRSFLSDEEKEDYCIYPQGHYFCDQDRTKVYSIIQFWGPEYESIINKVIKDKKIEYIILWLPPGIEKNRINIFISDVDNVTLVASIDGDKEFGYYIFKVD